MTRCASAAQIGGANGLTDFLAQTVTVRGDVDDAQAVKSLAHEAGHLLLHSPQDPTEGRPACRGLLEVEAESVAYLVAAHHGLDTSGYTFSYIAGWAGDNTDAVTATAERVMAATRTLLAVTDPTDTPTPTGTDLATATAQAAAAAADLADRATATRDRSGAPRTPTGAADTTRLRALTSAAQAWFTTQAATSADYTAAVTARGHTPEVTLTHGIGWAPNTWTGLVDHLRAQGHTDTDMLAAGVATSTRHGRLIDRFRGRITFPLHDPVGVIGWTGRDTTGHDTAPKYLNTPTTGLFDKSTTLYGLSPGAIRGAAPGAVVLVEGPWDALAVTTATDGQMLGLAACGTAVTDHHLTLAQRAGSTLNLAPDADPAGHRSLGRTLTMLADRCDPHPAAITTTPGTDLADLLATDGPTAIRTTLARTQPAGLVYAQAQLRLHPPAADTAEARVAAARAAAAHTTGLTLTDRATLGQLLSHGAAIGSHAAATLITPTVVVPPKPRTPATTAPPLVAAAARPRR